MRKFRRAIAALVASGLFIVGAGVAHAMDPTDIQIIGGSLSFTGGDPTVNNFANVTLDGTAKTGSATINDFEVNDARGSGAGWNVTVVATQFKEHNGTIYPLGAKTLAFSSLTMPAPTITADGTTSPVPTSPSGSYTLDPSSGTAVRILSAAVDAGMGKYDISTLNLSLAVPAATYAKTYRSEMTFTLASGPS